MRAAPCKTSYLGLENTTIWPLYFLTMAETLEVMMAPPVFTWSQCLLRVKTSITLTFCSFISPPGAGRHCLGQSQHELPHHGAPHQVPQEEHGGCHGTRHQACLHRQEYVLLLCLSGTSACWEIQWTCLSQPMFTTECSLSTIWL